MRAIEPPGQEDRSRARLSALSVVVFGLLLALLSRLWYLQVLASDQYGALAEGNRVRQVLVEAPRGRILDRQGRVLVNNRAAWAVTVKLNDMGDRRDEVLNRLARLLKVRRAQIDDRLSRYVGSPFKGIPVAEDVSRQVLFNLVEHQDLYPGVEPAVVALRHYPYGTAAAHMLGYVGEISPDQLKEPRYRGYRQGDLIGKAGLEEVYDRELRGRDGYQVLEVDATGEVVRPVDSQEPVRGRDLQLQVDLDVQQATERALREGLEQARGLAEGGGGRRYPAPAATAVVMSARDGSLLASASLPQYDPRRFVGGISRKDFARYAKDPDKPLLDRTLQSVYPPGSTWKPFTAMSALGAGIVTPSTPFTCNGAYQLGNYVKHDWTPRGHGTVSLQRSLEQSCDVYYYTLGGIFWHQEDTQEEQGRHVTERMQGTARMFGFDRAPAVDLPYAADGTVPDRRWRKAFWQANKALYCKGSSRLYRELCVDGARWRGGDNLNIAIGQGDVQVSPLQLAAAYGALANRGTVYAPHVGRAVVDPDTQRVARKVTPKVSSVVKLPASAFAAVDAALATVPRSGTATSAFAGFPLDRYPVAGKTGTADLPPKPPFAWFASFAPVGDPRYVVVVMVEQGGHGGETAAPVARRIYESLFGLGPTKITTGQDRSG
ncbi:MAG TPA: penicillin-binding protein 2 [Actinomycetes bacterium]|nr:penicillin-binding protein 2 [Actinomycetes bacterium]